jgi:plastocyanin
MAFVLGASVPAAAKHTPAQKCTGAKMKAAAKKVSGKLACYAKAASKSLPVDDACLSKGETTFTTAFSKAESKGGCLTVGDASAVETNITAFVQSEASAIPSGGTKDGGKCASSKLKAAGFKTMAKLLCNAKAATENIPVDSNCLGKANVNLTKAFAKAEKKGGCVTTGDAAAVGQAVDALVAQVVSQLTTTGGPTTTTTTTTKAATTTTGSGPTTTTTGSGPTTTTTGSGPTTTTTGSGPTTTTTGSGPTTSTTPVSATTSTTRGPTVHMVTVGPGGALVFDPATLPIHVGDTVMWVWDSPGHSVVSGTATSTTETPDGKFCSPSDTNCSTIQLSNIGATYEHTFNTAGTFPYFCAPHGTLGMTGMIQVSP